MRAQPQHTRRGGIWSSFFKMYHRVDATTDWMDIRFASSSLLPSWSSVFWLFLSIRRSLQNCIFLTSSQRDLWRLLILHARLVDHQLGDNWRCVCGTLCVMMYRRGPHSLDDPPPMGNDWDLHLSAAKSIKTHTRFCGRTKRSAQCLVCAWNAGVYVQTERNILVYNVMIQSETHWNQEKITGWQWNTRER